MVPAKNLIEQLKLQEGLPGGQPALTAYWDPIGNVWTIGYGHTPSNEGETIDAARAEQLLVEDVQKALNLTLEKISIAHDLDEVRFSTLVNMVFNMGVDGVLKFKNMLKAIGLSDWDVAADQMKDSLWAEQVGTRAVTLEAQMRTGQWGDV